MENWATNLLLTGSLWKKTLGYTVVVVTPCVLSPLLYVVRCRDLDSIRRRTPVTHDRTLTTLTHSPVTLSTRDQRVKRLIERCIVILLTDFTLRYPIFRCRFYRLPYFPLPIFPKWLLKFPLPFLPVPIFPLPFLPWISVACDSVTSMRVYTPFPEKKRPRYFQLQLSHSLVDFYNFYTVGNRNEHSQLHVIYFLKVFNTS